MKRKISSRNVGSISITSFLVTGDEILSVNGRGVQGLSHQQAIQLFRNIKSGQIVILLARRVLQVKK